MADAALAALGIAWIVFAVTFAIAWRIVLPTIGLLWCLGWL